MNIQQEFIPRFSQPVEPKIRFHKHGEATYFGQVYSGEYGPSIQREQNLATYNEQIYYVNNTHQRVTLLKRDGLTTVVEPKYNALRTGISICRVITLRGVSLQAMLEDLSVVNRSTTMELQALKEAAGNLTNASFIRELSIHLDYFIPTESILDCGGTIYHYQMDTVVSFKHRQEISAHPYSPDAHYVEDFGKTTHYDDQQEFNVKIRLVDHRKNAIPRYMRCAGKVVKLYPQRDMGYHNEVRRGKNGTRIEVLKNYVQVITSAKNDTEKLNQSGVDSVIYSIEEARLALGLFDHLSEAQDPERLRIEHTAALQTSTRELELLKASFAHERTLADHKADQIKMQLLERTQEIELLKQEHLRENTLQKQKQTQIDQLQEKIRQEYNKREERERQTQKMREAQTERLEDHYKYLEASSKHQLDMDRARMHSSSDLVKWLLGFTTVFAGLLAQYYKTKKT